MDALLPNSDLIRADTLYGKYKNIRERTVRIYGSVTVQYYLLKGKAIESDKDVFSILCIEFDKDTVTDSEFVFDVASNARAAERIYDILCRNTVTPCCLFEVLDSLLCELF